MTRRCGRQGPRADAKPRAVSPPDTLIAVWASVLVEGPRRLPTGAQDRTPRRRSRRAETPTLIGRDEVLLTQIIGASGAAAGAEGHDLHAGIDEEEQNELIVAGKIGVFDPVELP